MGLFSRNPNEARYSGGKKHFTDVIKNTGDSTLLIWRQPEEDFNVNSTLIVMPGEEAIFVKGGTIEQVFENGTYKLTTQNYPFISRLRNAFSGGISTFNCVVYFIKKSHTVEIKWGTDSPIQVRDKVLGISTKLRCRGTYKISIDNSSLFLEKMIGSKLKSLSTIGLEEYFIGEFQSRIKTIIAKGVNESNMELLGIDSRLDEFSTAIEPYMNEIVSEYGLKCERFAVSAIDIDDNELRQRYDQIGMDAISKLRNAQADKAVLDILGDDWNKQQTVNIMSTIAENPNGGGFAQMGAGIGMGLGALGAFGNISKEVMNNAPTTKPESIVHTATPANTVETDDPIATLKKWKQLLDSGLIEQTEYDEKKKEILSSL